MFSHVFPLNKRKHTLNALYTKDYKVIYFLHFNLSKGIFSTSLLTTQKKSSYQKQSHWYCVVETEKLLEIFLLLLNILYHTLHKECVIKLVRNAVEINGMKQYNVIGRILPLSVLFSFLSSKPLSWILVENSNGTMLIAKRDGHVSKLPGQFREDSSSSVS